MASWKYSDPDFRERLSLGLESVDKDELVKEYKEWVSHNEYTFLKHVESEKVIWCLNSKRGNESYARKQSVKYGAVEEALASKDLDFPAPDRPGFRKDSERYTYGLFVTFTIDSSSFSELEAWSSISFMINQFRAYLTKHLGTGYASHLVKESNSSGYPAPHMIILLNDPILAFKWRDRWRVQDKRIVDVLHDAWARYSKGSFVDIQAIVGDSVGPYLWKYITKSVDMNNLTAVYTHAYQKLFNLRDVISKSFQHRLDLDFTPPPTRLDCYNNELKPLKKRLKELEAELGDNWRFMPALMAEYKYAKSKLEALVECRPFPDWIYIDSAVVYDRRTWQALLDKLEFYGCSNF